MLSEPPLVCGNPNWYRHAKSWGEPSRSQLAKIKHLISLGCGSFQKLLKTGSWLLIGKQLLPSRVILLKQQKAGKVNDLHPLLSRESLADLDDFSSSTAHGCNIARASSPPQAIVVMPEFRSRPNILKTEVY